MTGRDWPNVLEVTKRTVSRFGSEFLVDNDRRGPLGGLIFAVNMLMNTSEGTTFSFEEIASWLTEAEFADPRLLEAPAPSPLILADKLAAS